jgi:hypothetical protein
LRVAALAFGVLAGLVASLVLALGGLDVGADLAGTGDRQAQAIRFGLLLIGNLAIFGAALVLASPLAGAIILIVGALAWVGAALVTNHTTEFVLYTPPALLVVSAILAAIAHFRRPRSNGDDDRDVEIIAPERAHARQRPSEMMDDDEDQEMGIPAFAAETPPPPLRSYDDDRPSPRREDWNPRRRQPPPPRTKPAFRPIEEEYDDEPSGFSRFALGISSVLSFGLYAALAGAAVLVLWNLRDSGAPPSAVVAEAPLVSGELASGPRAPSLPQPSSEPSAAAPTLTPTLTAEADTSRETRLPSLTPSSPETTAPPVAVTPPEPEGFGEVTFAPDGIPMLSDSFDSGPATPASVSSLEPAATTSEAPSVEPPPTSVPQTASQEPLVAAVEPQLPSVPAAGQPFPRLGNARMAILRQGASPGVTTVARPAPPANNTGL